MGFDGFGLRVQSLRWLGRGGPGEGGGEGGAVLGPSKPVEGLEMEHITILLVRRPQLSPNKE